MFEQKCPQCGENVARNAGFCPSCGTRMGGGSRRCGVCGTENRGDAQFCRNCGQSMAQAAAADVFRHRWARPEGDFAVRLEADDLPGLLKRGVRVEPGTNAMVITLGANQGVMPPGEYTLGNIGQRMQDWLTGNIPERVTVLLVDVTPTDLEFHLGGRFTKDPLPIGLTVRMQIEVDEPGKFLVNVLKARERLSIDDVRQYLYPEVIQVADSWLRLHTLQELVEDPRQRPLLEMDLEETLRRTFAQTGLRFLQVRAAELNLEQLEKQQGMLGQAALIERDLAAKARLAEAELRAAEEGLSDQERQARQIGAARLRLELAQTDIERQSAEQQIKALQGGEFVRLQGDLNMAQLRADFEERKSEMELAAKRNYEKLQGEYDLLTLSEETRKVMLEERRADLYERMRQAVLNDKIREVRSEAEFKALLDDLDHDKLLREKEREDLLRGWRDQGEDSEKARAHTLAKLEVERNYELRAAEFKLRTDLDHDQLVAELDLERLRVERQQQIETARYEFELKHRREAEEYERRRLREQVDYDLMARSREEDFRLEMERKRQEGAVKKAQDDLAQRATSHGQDVQEMLDELKVAREGYNVILDKREREKTIEWDDERRRRDHEWTLQRQKLEFEWEREQYKFQLEREMQIKQLDLDMQREREKMQYELQRLEKLAQFGPDALVALAGPEQARVLADLRKTEALKGMSEEQILALAAKDSPEVAKAFQEKYRAAAEGRLSDQERRMYERMMEEAKISEAAIRQVQENAARQAREDADKQILRTREDADKRSQEVSAAWEKAQGTADRALDRMADTAQTFARSATPPPAPVIITPPGGGPPQVIVAPGSASGGVYPPAGPAAAEQSAPQRKTCMNCGKTVPFDARFCEFCGHKFEGVA